MEQLSAAQWFVIWSLLTDHCPNPNLVQTVHDHWQNALTREGEAT